MTTLDALELLVQVLCNNCARKLKNLRIILN